MSRLRQPHSRALALGGLAGFVVLTLTSCTPATFMWGLVTEDSKLSVALCSSSTVTAVRLSVMDREADGLVEVDSAVWSGPRIEYPVGAILDPSELPDGWVATSELDLDGPWERVVVDLYDGARDVDGATVTKSALSVGRWSLSPRPGFMAGRANCPSPTEGGFESAPSVEAQPIDRAILEAQVAAMPIERFWALMGYDPTAGPREQEATVSSVETTLAWIPAEDLISFHAQLMLQYHALDKATVWNESERRRNEGSDYDSSTTSAFLELRSAVILGGPESLRAALAGESFPAVRERDRLTELPSVVLSAPVADRTLHSTGSIALTPGFGANADGW
jgi:hypothetical protein